FAAAAKAPARFSDHHVTDTPVLPQDLCCLIQGTVGTKHSGFSLSERSHIPKSLCQTPCRQPPRGVCTDQRCAPPPTPSTPRKIRRRGSFRRSLRRRQRPPCD